MKSRRNDQTTAYRAGYQDARDGRDPSAPRGWQEQADYWMGYEVGGNSLRHNPNAEPLLRHSVSLD